MNLNFPKKLQATSYKPASPAGGLQAGFTLIELLVVIAIIGILSGIVLTSLGTARKKGSDAATQAQLAGARAQAELYASGNNNSYASVCTTATASNGFGGAAGPGVLKGAIDSSGGAANVAIGTAGDYTHVTCHDSTTGWAMDAPMKSVTNDMWCVDSNGVSKREVDAYIAANGVACL